MTGLTIELHGSINHEKRNRLIAAITNTVDLNTILNDDGSTTYEKDGIMFAISKKTTIIFLDDAMLEAAILRLEQGAKSPRQDVKE